MKKDKKGFILVETIVVMSVVMIALLGIYKSYSTVIKKSVQSAYYDNINDIYRLGVIKKILPSNFLESTTFKVTSVGNETNCTGNCYTIVSELIDDEDTVSIILIPDSYMPNDLDTTNYPYKNSLKRYLETTDYNYTRLLIMRYLKDNKEHFVSLEVD